MAESREDSGCVLHLPPHFGRFRNRPATVPRAMRTQTNRPRPRHSPSWTATRLVPLRSGLMRFVPGQSSRRSQPDRQRCRRCFLHPASGGAVPLAADSRGPSVGSPSEDMPRPRFLFRTAALLASVVRCRRGSQLVYRLEIRIIRAIEKKPCQVVDSRQMGVVQIQGFPYSCLASL